MYSASLLPSVHFLTSSHLSLSPVPSHRTTSFPKTIRGGAASQFSEILSAVSAERASQSKERNEKAIISTFPSLE